MILNTSNVEGCSLVLSEDETKELLNTLLDGLAVMDIVWDKCFDVTIGGEDDSDFYDAVHGRTLEAGIRAVCFAQQVLAANRALKLDDEGSRLLNTWTLLHDNYDQGDRYDA